MNELTPLQSDAFKAKENLCKSIGDHGCGGCPLDELRREKNVDCDFLCLVCPDDVQQRLRDRWKEKAALRGERVETDWEATAKRLQEKNERLQIELNAERQRNVQMEKDLQVAREDAVRKDKLKERITGRYEAYREMLVMVLDRNGGKDGN